MTDFLSSLLFFVDNYWGVFLLMTIESSFIPFPSEVVIPPAAYLAFKGEMNVFLVILFGILGSLCGALVNYFLAMRLGRPLIYLLAEKRWAKFLLISPKKIEKAENHFLEYGAISTFLGRLLPAIRQLISLPAGFTRMPLGKFLIFTSLGSGIWVSVLAALGYFFGSEQERLSEYYSEITIGMIGIAVLVFGAVLFLRKRQKRSL